MAEVENTSNAEALEYLINDVHDWQYMHGSLLRIPPDTGSILAHPVGVALFPTPFPKALFEQAMALQEIYNKLYIAVIGDEQWLSHVLRNLIDSNSLVGILWKIHKQSKKEGKRIEPFPSMAFFRSDYMLHVPDSVVDGQPQLKQVEFNTFSLAGGVHSAKITHMHHDFNQRGYYKDRRPSYTHSTFPPNPTPYCLMLALLNAHNKYGPPRCSEAKRTAILIIVQPNNVNICDERPIEESLGLRGSPNYRVEFGHAVLETTSLSPSKELLFHHPQKNEVFEVSVVYNRAGYDEEEYVPSGIAARLRLEQSAAIRCPSILTHIAGSKKVQQELALPGALERFLSPEEAAKIRETFMPMYPLDDSEAGQKGQELALEPMIAQNYVLKPSKEGGGHNIYGSAISEYLQGVPREEWPDYILMEKIRAPSNVRNSLISFRGLHSGPVVSELGIFGMCAWEEDEKDGLKITETGQGSFSFKSKASDVDEISVVKGYGCFDSPWLV